MTLLWKNVMTDKLCILSECFTTPRFFFFFFMLPTKKLILISSFHYSRCTTARKYISTTANPDTICMDHVFSAYHYIHSTGHYYSWFGNSSDRQCKLCNNHDTTNYTLLQLRPSASTKADRGGGAGNDYLNLNFRQNFP